MGADRSGERERKVLVSRKKKVVPEVGLEPTHCCQYWILSPARLPIPPLRQPESAGTVGVRAHVVNRQDDTRTHRGASPASYIRRPRIVHSPSGPEMR